MKLSVYEKVMGYSIGWGEAVVDYAKKRYEDIAVCVAFPVTLFVSLLVCAVVMNR